MFVNKVALKTKLGSYTSVLNELIIFLPKTKRPTNFGSKNKTEVPGHQSITYIFIIQ